MECIQLSLSGKMFPELSAQTAGEDFRTVLEKLAHAAQPDVSIPRPRGGGRWCKAGAIIGNGWSLAWRLLNAERWGVPQRRKRIAVVADFRGQCAAEILFERTGLSGNPDKSIPTWQSVTGFTQNCPAGHDRVVAGEAAYTLKIQFGMCRRRERQHWCRQKRRERSRRFKTRPFSSQSSLTLVEMATVRQFRPLPGIMRAASQTIRLLRSICTTELLPEARRQP